MARKFSKDDFINKAISIHGDKYTYDNSVYLNNKKPITVSCKIHGDFSIIAGNFLRGSCCPTCSKNSGNEKKKKNTDWFISKSMERHGDKYDYSKSLYVGALNNIKIVCKIHGEFLQRPGSHISGVGCPKCGNLNQAKKRKRNTDLVVKKFKSVHKDIYDYTESVFISKDKKIKIICKIHGEFWQFAHNHISNKNGCPKCKASIGEKNVREILRIKDFVFLEQKTYNDCKNKNKLRFDFCVEKNGKEFLIEFDGPQHFEPVSFFGGKEGFELIKKRDSIKNKFCEENNIPLLRLSKDDDLEKRIMEFLCE